MILTPTRANTAGDGTKIQKDESRRSGLVLIEDLGLGFTWEDRLTSMCQLDCSSTLGFGMGHRPSSLRVGNE